MEQEEIVLQRISEEHCSLYLTKREILISGRNVRMEISFMMKSAVC